MLLELSEEGLPITKVPRSPQRLAVEWQQFFDAIVERRLTHSLDPVLARHAGNLALISGPSGLRPDLDVAEGHPVAAALAAVVAYDGVARIEPAPMPMVILPSGWRSDVAARGEAMKTIAPPELAERLGSAGQADAMPCGVD